MPDLGKVRRGVNMRLSDIHRAPPRQHLGRTEPEYEIHKSQGIWFLVDCKTNDTMVTRREDPLYRSKETMVMVQEDQAEEPWSSYVGLYTVVEGFKAPPECK